MYIPFDEKELEVRAVIPAIPDFAPEFKYLNYPLTGREAIFNTIVKKEPSYVLSMNEIYRFFPNIVPDNIARGNVAEAAPFNPVTDGGGKDMFGVEWVYIPVAMGSMEVEGVHLLEDVNDWKDVIVFPDLDSWDWEGCLERNREYLKTDKAIWTCIFTGWFERLISFMGFEGAAIAVIDEDQTDAIKELMMALSDTYCDFIERFVKWFGVDYFFIHDDWGSQMASFFNADVARELFVPAMKKVTDKCHELGVIAEFHSCGNHGAVQIENIIAAGWDIWRPQGMNPIGEMWEKYGDKIVLSPVLDLPCENPTKEQEIAAARVFVDRYCNTPGKPVVWCQNKQILLTDVVAHEVYIASREAYNKWYSQS